jgi:ABC-type nitrate/sulfonate/bicarbonate transport system substrate-binding protein
MRVSISRHLSVLALAALLGAPASASAADKIGVGKAFSTAFAFIPIDVGVESGIMQKHGLDVTISGFNGSAGLQQAVTAGQLDISLGSGTDMAFVVKGVPVKAVAAMAGPPLAYGVTAGIDSGINKVEDLKGRKIAVASRNSLVFWLTRHLSDKMGWGLDGMQIVYISGGNPANIAALRTKQVDALTNGIDAGYQLEKDGQGKQLVNFGKYVDEYLTHAIYATNTIMAERPEVLRRFLVAWFETIEYMRTHRDESVKTEMRVGGVKDAGVAARVFDEAMPMFSLDGHFDPKALVAVRKATVELEMLPAEPDMAPLYTEAFLPAKH